MVTPPGPQARSHRGVDHGSGNSRNAFTPTRLGTEVADIEIKADVTSTT
jgi:hypothetical protein